MREESTLKQRLPQFLATGVASLGALGLGSVAGYTSTALPSMQVSEEFSNLTRLNETLSWVGSIAPIGACVSGPLAGFLIEAIGRKNTMLLISPIFILGWLLIGFAINLDMVLAGRFLTGLGGGTFSLVVPVYVSEIAENSLRGMLGSSLQLMINVGVTFAYVIGFFVNWSSLAFAASTIPAFFLVLMLFMPETPRHLLKKGRGKAASRSLQWLRGVNSHEEIMEELNLIQESVDKDELQLTVRNYLNSSILTPIGISLALMLFQQWNGNNAIIFYTVQIFQESGTSLNPNIATIIVGVIQVAASIFAALLMDKAGRRVLLLLSGFCMAIALTALGTFFQIKEQNVENVGNLEIGWLPLLSLIVFIVGFALGFGPIAWLLAGEILPPNVRGTASALATSFNWLNAFVVTKAFLNIQVSLGTMWCFWIFGMVTLLGNIFVFFIVPETNGKSLQEIQSLFTKKK